MSTILYGAEALAFARENNLQVEVRGERDEYREVSLAEAAVAYHRVYRTGADFDAQVVRVDLED